MKKILPLFLLALLFSCKFEIGKTEKSSEKEQADEPTLELTTFPLSEVPEDFIGCTTGLFLNKRDKDKDDYIFIDDLGKNAIVGINGKQVNFKLAESPEGSHTYIYTADGYRLTIKITKVVESGYENSDIEAEFLLQRGSSILRKNLVGYRGC